MIGLDKFQPTCRAGRPAILQVLDKAAEWLEARRPSSLARISPAMLFAGANAVLILVALIIGPRRIWLSWTAVLIAIVGYAALRCHARNGLLTTSGVVQLSTARPVWLWVFFVLAVIKSMSPHIGFKTQTSVVIYSNMRTEGGVNNHYCMPVIPIFLFQDDLVEVISSNHQSIAELRKRSPLFESDGNEYEVYVNYFELRRAVSKVEADDLTITYRRNGEERTFRCGAPDNVDRTLDTRPSLLISKLLYFRPAFKGDKAYCLHGLEIARWVAGPTRPTIGCSTMASARSAAPT